MLRPSFGFKIHQKKKNSRNEITKKNCSPPHFNLPTQEELAPPYTSSNVAQNLLSDLQWVPLL